MKKRRSRISSDTWVILRQIGIGLLVILFVGFLIVSIWYGTRISPLTINTITVDGGETINHSEIETLVFNKLEGNYLGLVPKKFAWFFPKRDILSTVEGIERLYSVRLKRISGSELKITFQEYVAKGLWCKSVDNEECLFLDKSGLAFGQAPNLSGGSFLRFVTSGREMEVGQIMLEESEFWSLILLTELLSQQGWFVSHVELDQVNDAYLAIVGGGELKVSASETPEVIVENLAIILSSDEFSHIEPGNFQYIDLRFGNNIFVNEEIAVTEEETASSSVTEKIE